MISTKFCRSPSLSLLCFLTWKILYTLHVIQISGVVLRRTRVDIKVWDESTSATTLRQVPVPAQRPLMRILKSQRCSNAVQDGPKIRRRTTRMRTTTENSATKSMSKLTRHEAVPRWSSHPWNHH